jgi:hypothetical protein
VHVIAGDQYRERPVRAWCRHELPQTIQAQHRVLIGKNAPDEGGRGSEVRIVWVRRLA